jgi:5'-3' exonuclease
MKTRAILFIVSIVLLASCKSKTPKSAEEIKKARFESINLAEVNSVKKDKAYNLGKRLLETCNTSRFKAFSPAEATEKVIKNATAEKISATCQKIIHRNGKFIDMDLIEIIHDNETDDYVFRYNIKYEKKYFKRELKVTIDTQNKVSAINTKEVPKTPL